MRLLNAGWNRKAIIAFGISSVFSVASVWMPGLESLSGFAWLLGALFGAVVHYLLMRKHIVPVGETPPLTPQV